MFDAVANRLLSRGGVIDVDGCIAEVRDQHAGQIVIVFYEQDVCGTFAVMEYASELGEEEIFIEGLLDPALGVSAELRTES